MFDPNAYMGSLATATVKKQDDTPSFSAGKSFDPNAYMGTISPPVVKQATVQGAALDAVSAGTKYIADKATSSKPFTKGLFDDAVLGIGQAKGWCGSYASTLSTASKVGDNWGGKIDKVDKTSGIKAGDKVVIPLGVSKNKDGSWKGYGHVVTAITDEDANGNWTAAQSNADGRQESGKGLGVASYGSFNTKTLQTKYGNNWGAISGTLKVNPYANGKAPQTSSLEGKALDLIGQGVVAAKNYLTAGNKQDPGVSFGTPQALADYVIKNNVSDLQSKNWWKNNPNKSEAWAIIEKSQGKTPSYYDQSLYKNTQISTDNSNPFLKQVGAILFPQTDNSGDSIQQKVTNLGNTLVTQGEAFKNSQNPVSLLGAIPEGIGKTFLSTNQSADAFAKGQDMGMNLINVAFNVSSFPGMVAFNTVASTPVVGPAVESAVNFAFSSRITALPFVDQLPAGMKDAINVGELAAKTYIAHKIGVNLSPLIMDRANYIGALGSEALSSITNKNITFSPAEMKKAFAEVTSGQAQGADPRAVQYAKTVLDTSQKVSEGMSILKKSYTEGVTITEARTFTDIFNQVFGIFSKKQVKPAIAGLIEDGIKVSKGEISPIEFVKKSRDIFIKEDVNLRNTVTQSPITPESFVHDANGKNALDQIAEQNSKLNTIQQEGKQTLAIIQDGDNKVFQLDTFKYSDGKIGVSFDIDTDLGGTTMPFSGKFETQKEAVDFATTKANEFIAKHSDTDNLAVKKQLGQIEDELLLVQKKIAIPNLKDNFSPKNTGNKQVQIELFKAQPKTIEVAKEAGFDVSNYTHTVDNYALHHALKHFKDELPITDNDLQNIPDIIRNPDTVIYAGKTNIGLPGILYKKRYNGTTYYLEEVLSGKQKLISKTIYKTPTGASTGFEALLLRPSSEKTTTPVSVSNENIPQIEQNVNDTSVENWAVEDQAQYEAEVMKEIKAIVEKDRLGGDSEFASAVTLVDRLIEAFNQKGAKFYLTGKKTYIGEIRGKTITIKGSQKFNDTFSKLFLEGDLDSFHNSIEVLKSKYQGTFFGNALNRISESFKTGLLDNPDIYDTTIKPRLEEYISNRSRPIKATGTTRQSNEGRRPEKNKSSVQDVSSGSPKNETSGKGQSTITGESKPTVDSINIPKKSESSKVTPEATQAGLEPIDSEIPKKPWEPDKNPMHNTLEVATERNYQAKYDKTKKSIDRVKADLEKAAELKKQIEKFPRLIKARTDEQYKILREYTNLTANQAYYDYWTAPSLVPEYNRMEQLLHPTENQKSQFKQEYILATKKAISSGFDVPPSIIKQFPEFQKAVNSRARYDKGFKTSFANQSTAVDNSTKKDFGFKVKNQDGTAIGEKEIRSITLAAKDLETAIGPFKDLVQVVNLTIAHTKGKFPFLRSDAGGLYHTGRAVVTIGTKGNKAFAHEMAHALDDISQTMSRSTSKYTSVGGEYMPELINQAKRTMNGGEYSIARAIKITAKLTPEMKEATRILKARIGQYYMKPNEIFARMVEQYASTKIGDKASSELADGADYYHIAPGYWAEDTFAEMIPKLEEQIKWKIDKAREKTLTMPEAFGDAYKIDQARVEEVYSSLTDIVNGKDILPPKEAIKIVQKYANDLAEVEYLPDFKSPDGERKLGAFIRNIGEINPKIILSNPVGMVGVHKTTPYHEIAHAYYRTVLTERQRVNLLDEVKKEYGEMSDLKAEEKLVQDFAEEATNSQYTGFKGFIHRFMNYIKGLIGKIRGLYNKARFEMDILGKKRATGEVMKGEPVFQSLENDPNLKTGASLEIIGEKFEIAQQPWRSAEGELFVALKTPDGIENVKVKDLPADTKVIPKKQSSINKPQVEIKIEPQVSTTKKPQDQVDIATNADRRTQSGKTAPETALKQIVSDASNSVLPVVPEFGEGGSYKNKLSTKRDSSQDEMFRNIPKESNNPPVVRGGIQPPQLSFKWWKDKNVFRMTRETMQRNIEGIAGKDAEKVKQFLVDPIRNNENRRIDFNNNIRAEIKKVIVDEYGIKPKSKDDSLIQDFGEGLITNTDLQAATDNWVNVEKAAEYFKMTYDQLLDLVNKSRSKFGYEPILKRKDYFRHFQELSNIFTEFGSIVRSEDLPTEIAGLTGLFKPGKPFTTADLKRIGGKYTKSSILGMDNYLDSITKQIFHTDSVQRVRALEKYIRDSSVDDTDIKLSNFVTILNEYGNLIAGKKAEIDRVFEKNITGRAGLAVANWLKKQVGANMVMKNVSSAMTNFIPFTQSWATTEKIPAIRGMLESVKSPLTADFNNISGERSNFLLRRFPEEKIALTMLSKASDLTGKLLLSWVDPFVSKAIVAGKYFEYLSKGLSKADAMKLADDYAGRVITDRSFGQMPNLMNSKMLGVFTQFQAEVNNVYSFIKKDIPRFSGGNPWKLVSMLAQFAVYSYLFNEGYEKLTGRRPTIDPVYAGLTMVGMTPNAEDKNEWERFKIAAGDIGGNIPFGNLATTFAPSVFGNKEGGRFPIQSALPDLAKLEKGDIYGGLTGPLYYGLMPGGGGQLRKTAETAYALANDGSVETNGTERFVIDRSDPINVAKGLILGKWATKEGQAYLNGDKLSGLSPEAKQKILDLRSQKKDEKDLDKVLLDKYIEKALTLETKIGATTALEKEMKAEFIASKGKTYTTSDNTKLKSMILEIRNARELKNLDTQSKILVGKNSDEQAIILKDIKTTMPEADFKPYLMKMYKLGVISRMGYAMALK